MTRVAPQRPDCRVWWVRADASDAPMRRWPRALRSHWAQRCVASFLGDSAAGVRLGHDDAGRPIVLDPPTARAWSLSVSDTAGCLAVAVAAGGRLGIDIEPALGRDVAAQALPWLAPTEAEAIRAAPAPLRRAWLLGIWTQKEAYLKALGTGLDAKLSDFEVEANPNAPAGVRRPHATAGAPPIRLHRLSAGAHVGALASDLVDPYIEFTLCDRNPSMRKPDSWT
jgi:phosphopantetheinyl transferase